MHCRLAAGLLKAWCATAGIGLPQHLLCRIFHQMTGRMSATWQDLRALATCSQVCREWRSAAEEAALLSCASLTLDAGTPPAMFSSPAVLRWVRDLRSLDLEIHQSVCRTPGLRAFVQSASGLQDVAVWYTSGAAAHDDSKFVHAAFCDTALACSTTLTELRVHGYVPSVLAPSLQILGVYLDYPLHFQEYDLEVLLMHCQCLAGLQHLELQVQTFGPVRLSSCHLSGLCLPALRELRLWVTVVEAGQLDLSWPGLPRNFKVSLHLRTLKGHPELSGHMITSAAAVMQRPHDRLTLNLSERALLPPDMRFLSQIQASVCELTLHPQLVDFLPAAAQLHLCFPRLPDSQDSVTVKLNLASLSPHTHSVLVEVDWPARLEVMGFQAVLDRPVQLCVSGAGVVTGLPLPVEGSSLCYTAKPSEDSEQAAYYWRNQLAVELGDWNPFTELPALPGACMACLVDFAHTCQQLLKWCSLFNYSSLPRIVP